MSYLNKYIGKYGRKSVNDIMCLDPNIPADWEIIKSEYKAVDIDKVVIDGDTFTNYGDFQFVWEKSYVKSPVRSSGGAIKNLNSYATFVTPHLIINFSIMSIDDYRAIMRKDLERNEFVVECYDPIYNKRVSSKMYFATPQMAKLYTIASRRLDGDAWEEFVEIVGVQGYTVELIGTNNDLNLVSVIYHLNPPADTGYADETIPTDDIYSGQDVIIGDAATSFTNETFGGRYKFTKWNIDGTNPTTPKEQGNYINGQSYTINIGDEIEENKSALVLYAMWEATTDHTLNFNYGLADPAIDNLTYSYETSRKVSQGKSIGNLPIVQVPTVIHKNPTGYDQEYSPYYNGKWYKTPVKTSTSAEVTDGEPYWLNRDGAVYLLYDIMQYTLNLYIDAELYQTSSVEYNAPMNLPSLVRSGYTFDGWYTTYDFQKNTKVSGNMPPYYLALYARWIKQ